VVVPFEKGKWENKQDIFPDWSTTDSPPSAQRKSPLPNPGTDSQMPTPAITPAAQRLSSTNIMVAIRNEAAVLDLG
jgi:hypothetical protein